MAVDEFRNALRIRGEAEQLLAEAENRFAAAADALYEIVAAVRARENEEVEPVALVLQRVDSVTPAKPGQRPLWRRVLAGLFGY